MPLEGDARQRITGKIRRRDTHDNAGIGVAFVAGILAHAIGHHTAGLGCGRHHGAAGAHAEAVDAAAVGAVMHQLVVGGAERLVTGPRAVAAAVDQRLRMLDAKTDGERLGLDVHATPVQHREGIPRAMANRQHHVPRLDPLAAFQPHAADMACAAGILVDFDVHDLALEAVVAAQRLDGPPNFLHHAHQPEGADMRLADIQNFGRRAGLDEFRQHLAAAPGGVLDLAVQLAVGKRAGPALAELHVRFRVQHPSPPQPPGIARPLPHLLAAIQDNGAKTHLRQDQRGEQPARSGADHHRTAGQILRRARHLVVGGIRRRQDATVPARQHRRLAACFGVDRVDQVNGGFPACIHPTAKHGVAEQRILRHIEAAKDRRAQLRFGVIERQFQFGQAQHDGFQRQGDGSRA